MMAPLLLAVAGLVVVLAVYAVVKELRLEQTAAPDEPVDWLTDDDDDDDLYPLGVG